MSEQWKCKLLFYSTLTLFIGSLVCLNRVFFKQNQGFCIAFLYPSIENNPKWENPLPNLEDSSLNQILNQKFYYLAKGCHCYAFLSEDQKYVIKFHRYPSHMRLFSWAYHPFSYVFSDRRKKIKEHNMQRLQINFQSYKESYTELREETGMLLLHINTSKNLHKVITLIDKTHSEYQVSLDDVTFILQHKADLIFPKLDQLMQENNVDEAKKIVSSVIQLIATCAKKGYVNHDPVLRRNYGLIGNHAIHIDVGDLVLCEEMKLKNNYIPHIKTVTQSLREKIENCPALLDYYDREIQGL